MYHTVYGLFLLLGMALPVFIPLPFGLSECLAVLSIFVLFFNFQAVRMAFWFLLGVACALWRVNLLVESQLPVSLDREPLIATYSVVKVPEIEESGQRIEATLESLARKNGEVCGDCSRMIGSRVRLYHRFPDVNYQTGWVYRGEIRLKRPRGFVNPGGFDYQAWLLSRHVFATGYVKTVYSADTPESSISSRFKESVRDRFSKTPHHMDGVSQALLLGERSGISEEQWEVFRATGTSHLIAISGLHVGLLAFYVFALVRLVFRLVPIRSWLVLRVFPAVFASAVSGAYVLLSGASVPSQRAWCLSVLVMMAWVWGRRLNPFVVLMYSAVVVVLVNPLALTQNSFYLSFSAVAVLMTVFCFRPFEKAPVKTLALAQCSLTVALSVVQAFLGMPVSLSSILANCIAVPLMSLVGLPVLFLSAFTSWFSNSLSELLLSVSRSVMSALWWFLEYLSRLADPYWLPINGGTSSVVAVLGVVLILLPRAMRVRLLGVIILVSGCLTSFKSNDEYRLTVLDVGQGLSVVFETPEEVIVYDVGARFSDKFDIGSGVLAPYLRHRGRPYVDTLFISHGDNDHAGGETGLRAEIPVGRSFSNHGVFDGNNRPCTFGINSQVSSFVDVEVLWPMPEDRRQHSNHTSCVVVLRFAGQTVLLPGDIDRAAELRLVESGVLPKDVDILIAPHHGSISSSSYPFLKTVNAAHVIVSAGYLNRYGHPSRKVMPRYDALGALTWRTDKQGAVIFEWRGGKLVSSFAERKENPKPWFEPPQID